jgi:hypothetical protein
MGKDLSVDRGLLAVVRHCTVHISIAIPPDITIDLQGDVQVPS